MPRIPTITKNLLIINILAFVGTLATRQQGSVDLNDLFGLHFFMSADFHVFQLVSYMFMHAGWEHLIFNMISLFFFYEVVTDSMGELLFVFIYFGSMLLGNIFSLQIYKRQSYYSAIGASGAVSGIIFTAIALYPKAIKVNFLPGWLFGALYFGYSVFMMFNPQKGDNLGHTAHIGGALFGLAVVVLYAPTIVVHNALYLGIMALPLVYMGVRLLKN